MDFATLKTLLDYHFWARDRVLAAVAPLTPEQFTRPIPSSFSSIRDTLGHMQGADWVWCSRWEGTSPEALPDPSAFADLAALEAAWRDTERRIRAVVDRLGPDGVQQPLEYTRRGVGERAPFWQLVQHLVNHGSYHRGQVVTLLRQVGAAPPASVDLITFYREQRAAASPV